jgi:hypothetical protein
MDLESVKECGSREREYGSRKREREGASAQASLQPAEPPSRQP